MQFDDALRRHARGLMQIVDVLGDDAARLAALDQFGDRRVARIGFREAEGVLQIEAPAPGFPALLGAAQKFLKRDRRHAVPDAARAAKIRDAGLGGNAGAREHDHVRGAIDQCRERIDLFGVFPRHQSSHAASAAATNNPLDAVSAAAIRNRARSGRRR